jgi:hypothetical protein
VLTGGPLEPGQVGGHCQPQRIGDRDQVIGQDGRQFGEVPHAQTLRQHPSAANPKHVPGAARQDVLNSSVLAGRPIDKDHSRIFASWLFVQQRGAGPTLGDFGGVLDKHPGGLPVQVEGKS